MEIKKDMVFTRDSTITNVVLDEELDVVTGINNSGSRVVMTKKQFEEIYKIKE